jgi:hypothetical protein
MTHRIRLNELGHLIIIIECVGIGMIPKKEDLIGLNLFLNSFILPLASSFNKKSCRANYYHTNALLIFYLAGVYYRTLT